MLYNSAITSAALALLLGTAQAAPAPAGTCTSQGVKLRIQGLKTTQYLGLQRIALGVNIAIASSSPSANAPVFYQNGAAGSKTSTVVTDIPGVYPLAISVQGPKEFDAQFPKEHNVSVNLKGATQGLVIRAADKGGLSGPAGTKGAAYMVCEREMFVGGPAPSTLQVLRVRYAGEQLPAGCVEVKLVPECAVLPALPAGSSWDHKKVVAVPCSKA
ncbi:hypothetical protein Micbo1qcDRAFT_154928 [Microdochium bolleyi]|uniref:DUF7907 domain-containing protein n=1 Tax=Microdochium bolleyi TaxID=196109 RepID=A0A136JGU2_9PEZI|nr:hypothetical protein Micbo1qcDRAFT_154928 [Microdochium bolleyi]